MLRDLIAGYIKGNSTCFLLKDYIKIYSSNVLENDCERFTIFNDLASRFFERSRRKALQYFD